ncbi:hypothetical protein GCM10022379_21400 [Micromonospora maritima]
MVDGEPVHALDLLDRNPEPGGGVVEIHPADPTDRRGRGDRPETARPSGRPGAPPAVHGSRCPR